MEHLFRINAMEDNQMIVGYREKEEEYATAPVKRTQNQKKSQMKSAREARGGGERLLK